MKNLLFISFLCLIWIGCSDNLTDQDDQFDAAGVSHTLALFRAKTLSEPEYTIHFTIPQNKEEQITGQEEITFNYTPAEEQPLLLDFKESSEKIKSLSVNGNKITPLLKNEHLFIEQKQLKEGKNSIKIDFIAGNGALNRKDDFLYTLFVPDRARTVFPVFDQPDLKAVFKLTLTIPQKWEGTASGLLQKTEINGSEKTLVFAPTEKLPTYLFSFAAGNFQLATELWRDKEIQILYRETDAAKISTSLPQVFKEYKEYVTFIGDWTGIPYPFQKFGMVAIPNFQFGGMEHPGAILLQSSTLFLDKDATEQQRNNRSNLLAHEIAHSWFGDMVTMKWFDDVWTKEVFANFMADKATAKAEDQEKFDLKFLIDHSPAAYSIDRTLGANPIHQPLNNLELAGTLYGNIIYHKAPIMMRQLELFMGKKDFRKGIQTYLNTFAYKNATWDDLINILQKNTHRDLISWNKTWVNEPGRPIFSKRNISKNAMQIDQTPEYGEMRFWPQEFDINFIHPDGDQQVVTVNNSNNHQEISIPSETIDYTNTLWNASGMAYGVMLIDTSVLGSLHNQNALVRASTYIALYENMLNGRYMKPIDLLKYFSSALNTEKEELNLGLLTKYVSSIYWEYITPSDRSKQVSGLEKIIWKSMEQHQSANNKKILFKAYADIFQSDEARHIIESVWQDRKPPKGIQLSEDDYTSLALELQLRKDAPQILDTQFNRITNPDRKERFAIIRPAVSFDTTVRDSFFSGLSERTNRSNEPAVIAALGYLHHPLRQPSAEKYLQKSLELLPEIQKTGDIFFPGRWLEATFGKYQSKTAYDVVQNYLKKNPILQPKLKEKILQSTDNLRRRNTHLGL